MAKRQETSVYYTMVREDNRGGVDGSVLICQSTFFFRWLPPSRSTDIEVYLNVTGTGFPSRMAGLYRYWMNVADAPDVILLAVAVSSENPMD
jgi:hypothetical protein